MNAFLLLFIVILTFSGCTTTPYNPVASATNQTFLLNESSLAQLKNGMSQDQVHAIMGESIVIGYSYQKATNSAVLESAQDDYKPLTIANPYKKEDIAARDGNYTIEYYVSSIRQSDGVVTDDELVPLVFQNGILVGRGWDRVKALQKNPA